MSGRYGGVNVEAPPGEVRIATATTAALKRHRISIRSATGRDESLQVGMQQGSLQPLS